MEDCDFRIFFNTAFVLSIGNQALQGKISMRTDIKT